MADHIRKAAPNHDLSTDNVLRDDVSEYEVEDEAYEHIKEKDIESGELNSKTDDTMPDRSNAKDAGISKPSEPALHNVDNKKESIQHTVTELEKGERSIDEDTERALPPRWATLSFYGLAAIAIILPLIFVVFAFMILGMNHKFVTSKWNEVDEANKVFISAWPIVFASVVAQVFKSLATYNVERGIKLRNLERLMGSNSFGSSLKYPFTMRRLDLLALGLFLVWCFSPLGSQGLQRAYGTRPAAQQVSSTVSYVNMTSRNQMFAPDSADSGTTHDTQIQIAADYFMASLLPVPRRDVLRGSDQDRYDNPVVPNIDLLTPVSIDGHTMYFPHNFSQSLDGDQVEYFEPFNHTSAWGVPIDLPDLMMGDAVSDAFSSLTESSRKASPYEHIDFVLKTSYYKLNCNPFQTISKSTFDTVYNANNTFGMSSSSRFGISMQDGSNMSPNGTNATAVPHRPNFLSTVSLDTVWSTKSNSSNSVSDPNAQYSLIECTYDRVFINVAVFCLRGSGSQYLPVCQNMNVTLDHVESGTGDGAQPFLRNFAKEWMSATDLATGSNLVTIYERFLINGTTLDDPVNRDANYTNFSLSQNTTAADHAFFMGFLLNTWVNLGYCPECMDANDYLPAARQRYYAKATAMQECHGTYEYYIKWGWFALYLCSALLLLTAGIVSLIFETMSVAPDLFGTVSTSARSSRHLHIPRYTSAMPGSERMIKLGHVEVMLQDVNAEEETGRIVLGSKHEGARRLQTKRPYR